MKAPRFDGSDVANWISRVQYYFEHLMMPKDHFSHYVGMLFDPPVADWIFNYCASNPVVDWHEFLEDVRRRFDPHCFEDYLGLIAKLCQTGSLADYNASFENMRSKVPNHPELSFLSYYVAGLQQPVRNQVKHQHPTSVAAAMALAIDYASCLERLVAQSGFQRRTGMSRDLRVSVPQNSTVQGQPQSSGRLVYAKGPEYPKLPVIRLTAAEKADRPRRGVCWYCEEKWVPDHACKRPFLAYMGAEDDVETEEHVLLPDQPETEVITADLSHIYALEGKQMPAAIELEGSIGASPVRILVDTGSSHDFLHSTVAERLSLPLKAIRPFRMYVGNGESLLCSHTSVQTRLVVQNQVFLLDLHILPFHGPEVILGLTWLRSLRHVTNDYEVGTIDFIRNGVPVSLKVAPPNTKQMSLRSFASLLTLQGTADLFEIIPIP